MTGKSENITSTVGPDGDDEPEVPSGGGHSLAEETTNQAMRIQRQVNPKIRRTEKKQRKKREMSIKEADQIFLQMHIGEEPRKTGKEKQERHRRMN